MAFIIILRKSTRSGKKWMVEIPSKTGRTKTIHFGAEGYADYTSHKDDARKERYITRHTKKENWTKTGFKTAGFYSRWLLWNKKSLSASIADANKRLPAGHKIVKRS